MDIPCIRCRMSQKRVTFIKHPQKMLYMAINL